MLRGVTLVAVPFLVTVQVAGDTIKSPILMSWYSDAELIVFSAIGFISNLAVCKQKLHQRSSVYVVCLVFIKLKLWR